jgi:hypothetical protein
MVSIAEGALAAILRPVGMGILLLTFGFGLVLGDLAELYAAFLPAAGLVAG